jgi:septal ring factor EnvC (AmiA/AmiB activator)
LSSDELRELLTKADQAANEVLKGRIYISELEEQLKATDLQLSNTEKLALLSKDEIIKLQAQRKELSESIDALKEANLERVKEIAKMQKKINRLEGQVSFWRKAALIAGQS